MDLRQDKNYASYIKKTGWKVEKYKNNFYFIKNIPIIGGFIKLQRPEKFSIEEINKVINKHRPSAISVEPFDEEVSLIENGFSSKTPYIPSKTVLLDLSKSK